MAHDRLELRDSPTAMTARGGTVPQMRTLERRRPKLFLGPIPILAIFALGPYRRLCGSCVDGGVFKMKMLSLSVGALAACLLLSLPAKAETVTEDFSGSFDGNAVSGNITLDVVGGQAVDGVGTFTGFGLTDVAMVLITPSTPGNETSPGPVGYRANDGTDYGGLNTVIPINSIGLLFDVDTSTAVWGQFPLLNLASGANDSAFTGKVDGTEYYNLSGTLDLVVTPLPAAFYAFAAGLFLFGFFAHRRKQGDLTVGAAA